MKKRKVLVIEDEKGIRETLSEDLSDEGYAVTAVESG
jgi:CheY-like chemotaxis protein